MNHSSKPNPAVRNYFFIAYKQNKNRKYVLNALKMKV